MKKPIIIVIIILIAITAIVWVGVSNSGKSPKTKNQTENLGLQGEEIPILDRREHHPVGTTVTNYNSNPPTSGNHWPSPADWGFYDESLPDEALVHNLEHGGIWISYKGVDEAVKQDLKAVAAAYNQAVIVTPRPENDSAIAVVSWGRLLKLDQFDKNRIEDFIKANINNSPEKLARLEQPAVAVGRPFPDFSVTEVDGRTITNESLKRKPAIVWFTTEFCVPCQIGAVEVSKLDDELGGSAFEVLVIFVDSRETNDDLISWRNRFARDDWMVAFDNFSAEGGSASGGDDGPDSLSAKIGLKFLDSKYLLDKDGVIRNIDFQIADEKYLNIIRGVVKED